MYWALSMEHVAHLERFSSLASAAPSIFSYVKTSPVLRRHKLDFEYGMVDQQSARAIAKFTCRGCAVCRNAVVWVTAMTQLNGSWVISHCIGSMD